MTLRTYSILLLSILIRIESSAQYPAFLIPISIEDSTGASDTIQFGLHPSATNCIDSSLGEVEVPPDACCNWSGLLCAVFTDPYSGNGCLGVGLRLNYRDLGGTDTFHIAFCGTPPFTLRWSSGTVSQKFASCRILDTFGGVFYMVNMREVDSLDVSHPLIGSLNIISEFGPIEPPSSVGEGNERPSRFTLAQNYPNPFNSTTTISYHITNQSFVTLKVVDLLGREIETLVNAVQEPGSKSVRYDVDKLASGIYLYRIQVNGEVQSRKFLVQR